MRSDTSLTIHARDGIFLAITLSLPNRVSSFVSGRPDGGNCDVRMNIKVKAMGLAGFVKAGAEG